jgi:glycine cleavage system aminomethyltransferase T
MGSRTVELMAHTRQLLDYLCRQNAKFDTVYIVTNAGRREKMISHNVAQQLKKRNAKYGSSDCVQHEVLEGWGLVALQGPKAAEYLRDW